MSFSMIPAAVAAGIQAEFLANPPEEDFAIGAGSIFLQNSPETLVSPRIEIIAGESQRISQMDGSARQSIALHLITSLDDPEADHAALASAVDLWWRGLRANRKPGNFANCYVHDVLFEPPRIAQESDRREVISTFRGNWIVTLYDPQSLI